MRRKVCITAHLAAEEEEGRVRRGGVLLFFRSRSVKQGELQLTAVEES